MSSGPAPGILLALAIYLLQIPLGGWWLARYRFGPVGWLWRSLTYGRAQPMKRDVVAIRRAADGT
jgi:uncharacterized protein